MVWGEEPTSAQPIAANANMVEIDGAMIDINTPHGIQLRDAALAKWEASKIALETAKADEMEARKAAFKFAFGGEAKEGTNRVELNNGYSLKGVRKVNYSIKASNDEIDKIEDIMPTLGNEAVFLFERIIVWKPDFSKSEYNKLDTGNPTHRAVKAEIDKIIETKDGAPALEIEAPKGSKP
jgi:hypothetical protein